MNKAEFELDGDYIYKITPIMAEIETCRFQTVQREVVMNKKTFIEAFEKWIEKRA